MKSTNLQIQEAQWSHSTRDKKLQQGILELKGLNPLIKGNVTSNQGGKCTLFTKEQNKNVRKFSLENSGAVSLKY